SAAQSSEYAALGCSLDRVRKACHPERASTRQESFSYCRHYRSALRHADRGATTGAEWTERPRRGACRQTRGGKRRKYETPRICLCQRTLVRTSFGEVPYSN